LPVAGLPLVFATFQGTEEQRGSSFQNKTEAKAVRNVIHILLNGDVDEGFIGVIAPYRAQVNLLRSMFPPLRFPKLKIASVDSFQGSERDYIVMSCVRSGGAIGFVENRRRLNVSITRAKYGLVVVGDSITLSARAPIWRQLVDYFINLGAIITSIPETKWSARPDSDNDSGLQLKSLPSPVSEGPVKIVWPEDADGVDFLESWVDARLTKVTHGKFVTLAFDTESDNQGPLCFQIGEIFNDNFNPFDSRSQVPIVPPIGSSESVIVFVKNRSGVNQFQRISAILGPLFTNPKVTIATFDCTNDLLNLEKIGIQSTFATVVDCQVHGLPDGISHLTFAAMNTLSHRVECMAIDDPVLERAQALVAGRKHYPWMPTFSS
jgi:hypothetical protein